MEMDVNRHDANNLMTISLRCSNNNNGTTSNETTTNATCPPASTSSSSSSSSSSTSSSSSPPNGCCGILSRLFCVSRHKATQSVAGTDAQCSNLQEPLTLIQRKVTAAATTTNTVNRLPATQRRIRRTPQEIYFESRGKSCKKLLKFNGNSNKILLYPEEGWARTASSSYWTITPCWWQPNRCRIVEYSGTQRQSTKARMVPLEQQGSLLIAGQFRRTTASASATGMPSACPSASASASASATLSLTDKSQPACNDEFKLYLTSNISMEDYNMGYCLTGFVERRCQLTNTFQMTHFAVIKRQWPPPSNLSNS